MDPASIGLPLLILFFLLSAFFSASETAIFSLSELRIKNLATAENKDAEILDSFLNSKEVLLIGILLCNTLVNMAITALITKLFQVGFQRGGIDPNVGMVVAIPVATVGLLLFGEIVPKTLSYYYSYTYAMTIARPLKFIFTLLWPIIWVFERLSFFLLSLLGFKNENVTDRLFIQRDKIFHYLSLGEKTGTLHAEENEMLAGVCNFGDLRVKNIMTPRTSMTCIPVSINLEETLDIFRESEFSRFPVFRKDMDDLLGILHSKDLMINRKKILQEGFRIEDYLRPCYYIPENKKVELLLKEFQKEKTHLGMVVDEYGGTAGLVTLADILEEIVGDLEMDETEGPNIIETGKDCFTIESLTPIEELKEFLHIELPKGNYETLGGLIYDTLGRVPSNDESVVLSNGMTFKVLLVEGKKIRKIFFDRSTLKPPPGESNP